MFNWLTTHTWQDHVIVPADTAQVIAQFDRPVAFIKLTPAIVDVVLITGTADQYTVTERMTMLGFQFNHRFKAQVNRNGDTIKTQAWSFPKIHVQTQFTHRPHPDGTEVMVETTLAMPKLISGYVVRTAQEGRRALLDSLCRQFE